MASEPSAEAQALCDAVASGRHRFRVSCSCCVLIQAALDAARAEGVKAERERCAKIALKAADCCSYCEDVAREIEAGE